MNLLRTADVLLQGVAETLKALGLSPTQYNVLRILGKLEAPIADLYARQLGHLGAARLRTVIELLEQARSRAE